MRSVANIILGIGILYLVVGFIYGIYAGNHPNQLEILVLDLNARDIRSEEFFFSVTLFNWILMAIPGMIFLGFGCALIALDEMRSDLGEIAYKIRKG